jgi:hypothetical protein
MTRNRRVGGVSMYQRSLFGRKAKAQVDLGAHRRGIEKRLRRSHIFIARETRKAISSGGATSNLERPSMPLLTELVTFYVIVAIKISLLRSWESHPAESIPEADHVFQSLSCEAWLF